MMNYFSKLDEMMKEVRRRGLMDEVYRHARVFGISHDPAYWYGVAKVILGIYDEADLDGEDKD